MTVCGAALLGAPPPSPAAALDGPPVLAQAWLTGTPARLQLRITTVGTWSNDVLAPGSGNRLCVSFWSRSRSTPRARACLQSTGTGLVLEAGKRVLAARVVRPDERTVLAVFAERELGVNDAVLYWRACATGCVSRTPAGGKATLDLRPTPRGLAAQFQPPPQLDSRDVPGSPLDLRAVSFGQSELRMVLRIRTESPWATTQLTGSRSLCIVIAGGDGGNLCAAQSHGRAILRYQPTLPDGRPGTMHLIPAIVSRPTHRTLRASFPASELAIPLGAFGWAARSTWQDARACPAGCIDRVPDSGSITTHRRVLAEPHCFAAAARDPLLPCVNPTLARVVYPRPTAASLWTNAPCRPTAADSNAVFDPCLFGISKGAAATVALIGDSHAIHWRAALEVVAQAQRWRAFSVTRAGCPFSTQIPRSPALGPAACAQLHQQTLAWLHDHASIHTVFISDWAEPPGGPQGGTGGYGGGPAQFGAMLDQLPSSVQNIYVLRDIPRTTLTAIACVSGRLARHRGVRGSECTTPRSTALIADPGAQAARARAPRAHVLDLTRMFCTATRCLTVVGASYVYKDDNHMNAVFSQSLGPFVLRALGGHAAAS